MGPWLWTWLVIRHWLLAGAEELRKDRTGGVPLGHSQPPEVPLRAAALQRCTAAWLPSGGWRGREGTSPLTAGGGFSSVTVLGRSLVLSVLNFLHATVVSHVQCALLLTYFT